MTEEPDYVISFPWPIASGDNDQITAFIYNDLDEICDSMAQSVATRNTNYLWGKTPALDILNLKANEGLGYDKGLRLRFDGNLSGVGVVHPMNLG